MLQCASCSVFTDTSENPHQELEYVAWRLSSHWVSERHAAESLECTRSVRLTGTEGRRAKGRQGEQTLIPEERWEPSSGFVSTHVCA